jgi:hypothetical protein
MDDQQQRDERPDRSEPGYRIEAKASAAGERPPALATDELQEPRDLLGARLLVVQSGSGMGGDDHFG